MYISGDCCATGNEPFDIARWIKAHCTEEWKKSFTEFDGMARDDWLEYMLPWNWTVHYDNSTGNVKTPPRCHRPSYYLKMYVLESSFICVSVVLIPWIQLSFHYSVRWKIKLPLLSSLNDSKALKRFKDFVRIVTIGWSDFAKHYLMWPLKKLWQLVTCKLGQNKSSATSSIKWDVVQALAMALIGAGLTTGITIFNAFHLKAAPGFEHIHSWRLALLWFARPNLSWMTCVIGLFHREWLVKKLKKRYKEYGEEDHLYIVKVFTKAAYSAAISELLTELLGFYSLIRTTQIGRIRGFYISHHLYRFYRGHAARRMYNGALVWSITVPALSSFWALAIWKFTKLMYRLAGIKVKSKDNEDNGKRNRKDFSHSVGVTLFGWLRKKKAAEKLHPPRPLPAFRSIKAKRKGSSHPYHPPNAVQRFIIKYIIRGRVKKCLGVIFPEGRLRVWIQHHLLRTSLGDAPQRSLSRSMSIHAHADGSDSSGLLYHQEGLDAQANWEMGSIPGTYHNENTRRMPTIDIIGPGAIPQGVQPRSTHVSYTSFAGPYSETAPESDPFLSPEEKAETTSRLSDLHPRSLRSGPSMRRRPNPVQDYSAYETIPTGDMPESFSSRARPAWVQQPNPQNSFADPISVATVGSERQSSGIIHPQSTSYVHELPTVEHMYDPGQLEFVAQEEEGEKGAGLKAWLRRRIKEAEAREERQKELQLDLWEKDSPRVWGVLLALGLGLISYVCQWMFWEGFVNVAGDK